LYGEEFTGVGERLRTRFPAFLVSGIFLGIAQSVDGSTLTNYLKEHFGMLIIHRSALEFPRELPGLLVVFMISALLFFGGDVRISAAANILAGIGMFALGYITSSFAFIVITMFVYSMGQHIFMPLSGSIGMSFAQNCPKW
jgi:hypothetical protein